MTLRAMEQRFIGEELLDLELETAWMELDETMARSGAGPTRTRREPGH